LIDARLGRRAETSATPPPDVVAECVARALDEDLSPDGDLTAALLPEGVVVTASMGARSAGVLAGSDCVPPRRSDRLIQTYVSTGGGPTATCWLRVR